MIEEVSIEPCSAGAGVEGDGNMATSSAFAVDRSFKGLLSEGTKSELREVHQVPEGKRCKSAYFFI